MKLYSKDESPVQTGKIGVLPRTWVMFNAYRKARSLWLQQAQRAYADVGEGNLPKYMDFKVFADEGHISNYQANTDIMLPMDFDENVVTMTDVSWDYSKFHSADSTSDAFFGHVLGRHLMEDGTTFNSNIETTGTLDSAGLILSYQASRGIPNTSQNLAGQSMQGTALYKGPFGSLTSTDDQQQDIINQHRAGNESPPYDYDEYPGGGGELKEMTTVWTGKIAQKQQTPGTAIPVFEAPLGLLRIEVDASSALSSEDVEVHFDTEIIGTI